MLFEYIERMRARPREERQRFTLVTSFSLTGVIALLWLVSIFASSFGEGDKKQISAAPDPTGAEWNNLYPGAPKAAERESSRLQELMNAMSEPPSLVPPTTTTASSAVDAMLSTTTVPTYATSTTDSSFDLRASTTPLDPAATPPIQEAIPPAESPRDPFSEAPGL